jgi:hypothetical protein
MNKPNIENLLRSSKKLKKFQEDVAWKVHQDRLREKWKKIKTPKEINDSEKSGKFVSAVDKDAGENKNMEYLEKTPEQKLNFKVDENDFVRFGDVSLSILKK